MAEATAREQLILELMNRARMDPAGEAQRYGIALNQGLSPGTIDASAKQVLAFNPFLNGAADTHSGWMLSADVFSHTGPGGNSPGDRMKAAGYNFAGSWTWGENIAWSGTTGSLNGDAAAAQHHQNLFLSAGHRVNILNGNFREAGVGSLTGQFTSGSTTYNALMTTEAFAASGSNRFVTGVVYDDANADEFYSIGEGQPGRTVTLFKDGVALATGASGTAGGYALGTTVTGLVDVQFSGGGLAAAAGATVTLSGSNIKVDLLRDKAIFTNASAVLTGRAVELQLLGTANLSGTGNSYSNVLEGNAGNNRLSGNGSNDLLLGKEGRDVLIGGPGYDRLNGGAGADILRGGQGVDFFIFRAVQDISGDLITDFIKGEDIIDLQSIDAVPGGADSKFHVGTGAGGLSFRQSATQTFIDGDLDGDGTADFTLTLSGLKALTSSDFIL